MDRHRSVPTTPLRISCLPMWKNTVGSLLEALGHQNSSPHSIRLPCASIPEHFGVIEESQNTKLLHALPGAATAAMGGDRLGCLTMAFPRAFAKSLHCYPSS